MRRALLPAALLILLGTPGFGAAATLQPLDKDGLNLRAGPGTANQVVGGLGFGESASILAEGDGWIQVGLPSGQNGWVASAYSRMLFGPSEAYATVNTDVLNLRTGASLSATVLTTLLQGLEVNLLEITPGWWRVKTDGGIEGWVAAEYMHRVNRVGPPPPPAPTPPPVEVPPPPPAPNGTVPVLPFVAPKVKLPAATKSLLATSASGVYGGRHTTFFSRLDSIQPGESLRFLDSVEGWVEVETARNVRGWLPGSAVSIKEGDLLLSVSGQEWRIERSPSQPEGQAGPFEQRGVRDEGGLHLRGEPLISGLIFSALSKGNLFDVLQRQGDWLQIKTAFGMEGWVLADETVLIAPAAPIKPPGLSDAHAIESSLKLTGPGRLQLQVQSEQGLEMPIGDGTGLLIPFDTNQTESAFLPIGSAGMSAISINADGIRLAFDRGGSWKVIESLGNQVTVEIRPIVRAVTVQELPDRTVYRFAVDGFSRPVVTTAGQQVVVDFPEALPGATQLPAGTRLEATEKGARFTLVSTAAFELKQTPQGDDLHLYKPGLAGKVILLDPGHGGYDGGASNAALGIKEHEVNLQIGLRLRALLAAKGATVLMTRANGHDVAPSELLAAVPRSERVYVDLGYRTRMSNELGVDLFASIHHNAGSIGSAGTETYFSSVTLNGEQSRSLAQLIQAEVVAATGFRDRGAKDNLFYVTRNTDAPAILLEVGFVNNPNEGALIKSGSFQEKVAEAVVRAMERFFAGR